MATLVALTVITDGGGSYSSLASCFANMSTDHFSGSKDLVGDDKNLTIDCSGSAADTSTSTLSGWTTDATRDIVITGDGTYQNTALPGFGVSNLQLADDFVTLDNYRCSFTTTGSSRTGINLNVASSNDFTLLNCEVLFPSTHDNSFGISFTTTTTGGSAKNCVSIGCGYPLFAATASSADITWVNNTTESNGLSNRNAVRIPNSTGTVVLINNLGDTSGGDDYSLGSTSTTDSGNASSDTSAPGTAGDSKSWTLDSNYEPVAGDTDIHTLGAGPSDATYGSYVPTTDRNGVARSGSTCTSGAYEYVAAGGATPKFLTLLGVG